jgi:hypothetical protein
VLTVSPGDTPQALLPQMLPPPYMNDKPPAYTDIYKQHPGAEPTHGRLASNATHTGNAGNVDAGMECVAAAAATASAPGSTLPQPPQPSALPPTPTTPPRTPEEEAHHAYVTPGGSIAIV